MEPPMPAINQRTLQAKQTRQQLLNTAYQLIGESGYEALSTAALVKAAGVTKGALYHHFDCLEDVAYCALEQALSEGYEAINIDQTDTVISYLDAFEQYFFTHTLNNPVASKALFSFVRVGMFNERYRKLLQHMLGHGLEKFSADLSHFLGRELSNEQLGTIARLIDAVVGGLGVHWYTLDNHEQSWRDWQAFRVMLMMYIEHIKGDHHE
jgi:AcrR family transcriptional regulator